LLNNAIWICILSVMALVIAYICTPAHRYRVTFIVILLGTLLIRFAVVMYIYRQGYDAFGTDGLLYHRAGIQIAVQLDKGISIFRIEYPYTWYTVFIGIIYYLFGVCRYYASFINAFIAFLSGILVFKIALKREYSFENSAFISILFLYFPNIILWTSDTRKESLIILVSLLIWYIVQDIVLNLHCRRKPSYSYVQIVTICLLIWIATLIRIYLFVPIVLGIVASQLIQYAKDRNRICLVLTAAVIASSVIIFFTTVYPGIQNHHALHFPESQTDNVFENILEKLVVLGRIVSSRNLFVSVLNYLIMPLPGNLNIADIMGMERVILCVQVDMLMWYISLALIPAGVYTMLKSRNSCFIGILVNIITYILINALLVENVPDTIYRYRAQIVGLSLLFIDGKQIKAFVAGFIEHISRVKYKIYID
jgi:hypothetical protein